MKKAFVFVLIITFIFLTNNSLAVDSYTLTDCVNIAYQNNSQVKAALSNVAAAEGMLQQAYAKAFPNISLSSAYQRSFQSPSETTFSMGGIPTTVKVGFDEPADNTSLSFNLSQPIYMGGQISNAMKIAKKQLEIAQLDLKETKLEIYLRVAQAYYNTLRMQKLYKLSQDSYKLTAVHLKQAQALLKHGMVTKNDILRAQVQLSSMEQNRIKMKNSLDIAISNLNIILGKKAENNIKLGNNEAKRSADFDKKDYQTLLKTAFFQRPDIIKAGLAEGMARDQVGLAFGGYLPNILLAGSYGWANSNYKEAGVDSKLTNWQIAAQGSWTLFNGFETHSKVNEANARLKQAEANLLGVKEKIQLEVRTAYLDHISFQNQIKSMEKSVEFAEQNLEMANLKYKEGVGTNLEVLDAENAFLKAKVDLYSAQYDYLIALVSLKRAIGEI